MSEKNTRKCPECSTEHTAQRGNCEPLSKRVGPAVTDENHPVNNGSFTAFLSRLNISTKVHGPFAPPPGAK